jgi:MFS family permease
MVNVLGMSATAAGTAQIPLMVAFVASSNIVSQIVQRVGRYKMIMLAGFVVMLIAFVLLTQIGVHSTMWDVTWRMFLLGLGMGPALPLLNLAMQNAVPFKQIGSATASRQFFQQLGQAIGAAVFGLILTTTLTTQMNAHFAPILASAPPEWRDELDPAQFRSSVSGAEGAGGEQVNLGDKMIAATNAPFDEERRLVTAALRDGDAQARAVLLASPTVEPQLKNLLAATSADQPLLEQALAIVDEAQQAAAQEALTLAGQVVSAVRISFANSITQIYFYALWLVALALVIITIWLPELPLRKTNRTEAPAFES